MHAWKLRASFAIWISTAFCLFTASRPSLSKTFSSPSASTLESSTDSLQGVVCRILPPAATGNSSTMRYQPGTLPRAHGPSIVRPTRQKKPHLTQGTPPQAQRQQFTHLTPTLISSGPDLAMRVVPPITVAAHVDVPPDKIKSFKQHDQQCARPAERHLLCMSPSCACMCLRMHANVLGRNFLVFTRASVRVRA